MHIYIAKLFVNFFISYVKEGKKCEHIWRPHIIMKTTNKYETKVNALNCMMDSWRAKVNTEFSKSSKHKFELVHVIC